MADASRKLLLSSVKGDLTITCGSDSYNVHKVIVCSRADFFARAVQFPGKESQDGKVDLHEVEPEIVKLLVQYLYEGEYDPSLPTNAAHAAPNTHPVHTCPSWDCNCRQNICPHHQCGYHCDHNCQDFSCDSCASLLTLAGPPAQLLIHSKMYEAADTYQVMGLKGLASDKFSRACALFWNDDAFPAAAHHAFSTTMEEDKGLRDVVAKTISEHMVLLEKAEVEALMTEFNGLAFRLLKEKSKQHGWR